MGPGQSLHNEILAGAKRLNCHWVTFLLLFVIGFLILIPSHLFHTICRVYAHPTFYHQQNTPVPADAMEIVLNEGMHALPPTWRIVPVAHAPGKGYGQCWQLASAGIAIAVATTPQPRQCIFKWQWGGVGQVLWIEGADDNPRPPICRNDRQKTISQWREWQRQAVAGKRASTITWQQQGATTWACRYIMATRRQQWMPFWLSLLTAGERLL